MLRTNEILDMRKKEAVVKTHPFPFVLHVGGDIIPPF